MNFSQKSIDLLFELKLRDSKEYYEEQKPLYKKLITEPFSEIAYGLAPIFEKIDKKLVCAPKCISRVRRDTRFTKDKSLFRDHIWINVSRPRERMGNTLSFYFCIEQTGFSYGCGYYQAPADVMESLRELVLNNDKKYLAAEKMLKNSEEFSLYGDFYKKNKYPDAPPEKQQWLCRKGISVNSESRDKKLLFGNELIPFLADEFEKLSDIYYLLQKAEEESRKEDQNGK